jgi:hypothetical protein
VNPRPSELEYLAQDRQIYDELVAEHQGILAPLADFTDLTRQNYLAVVVDLYYRVRNLCAGVEVLLEENLREAFILTQRGLFEALSTISYITKHPRGQEEALVFRAYSALKHIQLFTDQKTTVDLRALLKRMPEHAVQVARRRFEEHPRSWSGLTIRKMATAAKVTGYDTFYAFASAEAHVGTVGDRIQVMNAGDGTANIEIGIDIRPKELEAAANFARRALKHAFFMMWNVFDGPAVTLPVHDPDEWPVEIAALSDGLD